MHRRRFPDLIIRGSAALCLLAVAEAACAQEISAFALSPDYTLGLIAPAGGENFAPTDTGSPSYGNGLNGPTPELAIGDVLNLALPSRIPFHFFTAVTAGYDSDANGGNGSTSSGGTGGGGGSEFVGGTLGLSYEFGTPRTHLALQANGGVNYYTGQTNQGSAEYNASVGLRLTHKLSARLNFESDIYFTYTPEPNYSLNLGINRRIGSYFYSSDQFILSYAWTPRFSTTSSYMFGAFFQEGQNAPPPMTGNLSDIGNSDNRVENTFSNQFRFLLLPTVSAVAEYRLGFITYQNNASFNSTTNSVLAGFDQTFSPRLTASFRAGVEFRSYESDGDSISPTFQGTLNYRLGRRSSVSLYTNYGLQPADVVGVAQRTNFSIGLNGSYQWTSRISSALGITYGLDDYGGTGTPGTPTTFSEDTVNVNLSSRYAITRYFGVQAGYNFTGVTSTEPGRAYSRNHLFLGVDFNF